MALPPSTANWHWKNKNITKWGEEWMKHELTSISVTGNRGEVVNISSVNEVDGDVELGQRKSKLITIFDTRVSLSWTGKTSDGTEVKGSLTIPEVSHETICDKLSDLVYEWSLSPNTSPSNEVDMVYDTAKRELPPALEAKLATFPQAIIDTHGKDLTVSAEPSRTGTPIPSTPADKPAAPVVRSALSQSIRGGTGDNVSTTTTVKVTAILRASPDDLFTLLTNESKIPLWTRDDADKIKLVKRPKYSLFDGNVEGEYKTLEDEKQKLIVQTWKLNSPNWPSGHYGKLTTSFNQLDDSTEVIWSLEGVPEGKADQIKRDLERYYIHGLKSIGYVELIVPELSYVPSKRTSRSPQRSVKHPDSDANLDVSPPSNYLPAFIIGALVLVAAFSIPYFSSSPASK